MYLKMKGKIMRKVDKGKLETVGDFNVITQSCKSTPGDGTHGNGVKGDNGDPISVPG